MVTSELNRTAVSDPDAAPALSSEQATLRTKTMLSKNEEARMKANARDLKRELKDVEAHREMVWNDIMSGGDGSGATMAAAAANKRKANSFLEHAAQYDRKVSGAGSIVNFTLLPILTILITLIIITIIAIITIIIRPLECSR